MRKPVFRYVMSSGLLLFIKCDFAAFERQNERERESNKKNVTGLYRGGN
jgi:hypothetical protein